MFLYFVLPAGQFVLEHHTLPGHKSHLMPPDHLGGIEFDIQLLWSAQTFDSPYQLWRATSSYSRSVSLSTDIIRGSEGRRIFMLAKGLHKPNVKIHKKMLVGGLLQKARNNQNVSVEILE